MKFGSVCSGIEAASVAWRPVGFEPAWFSEIEPFPCHLLRHHYPDVPNYGDMTLMAERVLFGEAEAPDIFCGGTPCQAFSVAGNRQSLSDDRGNLSLTFCEIANAIDHVRGRDGDKPTIIFWENVPGCLSADDNFFGCFLGELSGSGCEGGGKGYLGQDEHAFKVSCNQDQHLLMDYQVRKLTPTECERLMGFPDGYTKINNKTADSPRYKALGNSWPVPVVRWIGQRIKDEACK